MFRAVTFFEKLRHGAGLESIGHKLRAFCQDQPGGEGTDKHISYTYPYCRKSEIPAEFSRIADEYDRTEISGSVSERAEPPADSFACEHKVVQGFAFFGGNERHNYQYGEVKSENNVLCDSRRGKKI